ncbi:LuxR family transcriptional regulator [Microbacterium terregens]
MDVGDPPDHIMLTTSLLVWLRQLAAEEPVALIFDDIQWTDPATARILSLVARRLEGMPVALVVSQRTGEGSPLDRRHVVELELAPIDAAASEALLREHSPHLHPAVRRRIEHVAAGNPLALVELPRGLSTGQEVGSEMLPESTPLTERLRRLFADRVEELPDSTRELLLLAALHGVDDASFAPLIAAAADDLVRAESTGLVHVARDGQHLRFRHPLTRAAIVEMATPGDRRSAHARLARLASNPFARALHRAESTVGFDDDVARDLDDAAITALGRGDVVRAITVMIRAAELTTDLPRRSRRLAEAAYLGSHVTGRMDGAQAMLHRARLANPDAVSTLESATAAASHLANSEGGVDSAHRMLTAALDATPRAEREPRALEAAVTTMLFICAFGGREELWAGFEDIVGRFAGELPRALSLSNITFGDPARSAPSELRELDSIVAMTDNDVNPVRVLQVAVAGHYVNRMPKRAVERVINDARAGGAVAAGATCLIMLAADAFFEGRWDEARHLSDECIAMCEEHGLKTIQWGGMSPRMLVAAGRGDKGFLAYAHEQMRNWALPRRAGAVPTFVANADGLLALGEGRFRDAYEHYLTIGKPGTFPVHEQVTMWTVLDVVEACVGSGLLDEAQLHVHAASNLGLREISPRLRLLCDAAAAFAAPDESYEQAFETVLASPLSDTWPFHLARVELAYGDRLRHHREMRRARPHLERAAGIFSALNALPWAERAAAALRATGQVRRRSFSQEATDLTPQEKEVARLAASGLSNKQIGERMFLSARTVSGHLYRVFPKLGVSSRAGLRDALMAVPPTGGPETRTTVVDRLE